MSHDQRQRVAVFVDVDNLSISAQSAGLPFHLDYLIEGARREGVIVSAHAYADWSLNRRLVADFHRHAVEMTELSIGPGTRDKNTADIQITADAMELALGPHAPDVIVLASGDRDFVPLVQKLRRYGIRVVGIGIEGAISGVLQRACDEFIAYNELLPGEQFPAPVEQPLTDAERARALLVRAVSFAAQHGQLATDSLTMQLMQELEPSFAWDQCGLSFQQLADRAAAAGWIELIPWEGGGFLLQPARPLAEVPGQPGEVRPLGDRRPESPKEIADMYREILLKKRVPLLDWTTRQQLVRCLWDAFDQAGFRGLSFALMKEALTSYARTFGINVPVQAIEKVTYTLNIAECLSLNGETPQFVPNPDRILDYFKPIVDADEALRRTNRTYLKGILIEQPHISLVPEAVAILLFDEPTEEAIEMAEALIEQVQGLRPVAVIDSGATKLVDRARVTVEKALVIDGIIDAVQWLEHEGKRATGAAVRTRLVQGNPALQLMLATRPFKSWVEDVVRDGRLRVVEHPGSDFELRSVTQLGG